MIKKEESIYEIDECWDIDMIYKNPNYEFSLHLESCSFVVAFSVDKKDTSKKHIECIKQVKGNKVLDITTEYEAYTELVEVLDMYIKAVSRRENEIKEQRYQYEIRDMA